MNQKQFFLKIKFENSSTKLEIKKIFFLNKLIILKGFLNEINGLMTIIVVVGGVFLCSFLSHLLILQVNTVFVSFLLPLAGRQVQENLISKTSASIVPKCDCRNQLVE